MSDAHPTSPDMDTALKTLSYIQFNIINLL